MNPIILSDSILEDYATLTATDTDDGYNVLNVIDKRPYTFWQAANVTVHTKDITLDLGSGVTAAADCMGIYSHNLFTAGAFIMVYYSDNGADWTTAMEGYLAVDDKAILKTFTSATKRYWRIRIFRTGVDFNAKPKIAVLMLGARLEFPYPPDSQYTPNPEEVIASSNKGRTGYPLGSVLSFIAARITAKFSQLTDTWVTGTFHPWFVATGRQMQPFFWAWNLTAEPASVHYVKLVDNPKYLDPRSRAGFIDNITLEMEGVAE